MNKKLLIIISALFFIAFSACKTTRQAENKNMIAEQNNQLSEKDRLRNSALFIDANKEKILGNYQKASELFSKCIEIDPSDAASMYELAKIYTIFNKNDEALLLAEKAVKIDSQNVWYQILLSRLYKINEKYDDGIKVLSNLVKTHPDNIDYYLELASDYIYSGKYNDAIKIYNKIEEKTGISEQLTTQKKNLFLQLKQVDKAVKEVEKLIEEYPEESRYYAILAELCLSNNLEKKALKSYNKIIEINPNDAYIHISLSDYYRKKGDKERSFEELKLGFANPNLDINTKIQILLSYYTIIELYSELKDQAFELSEILINTHPDDPKAHSIYSDLLYQDNQFDKAKESLHFVLSLDSSKYIIWEQLLFVESELKDNKSMADESQRAIELFPEQALLYLFNGVANFQLKNFDKSIEVLNRGLKFIVNNDGLLAQFYSYLGDAYNEVNNYKSSDEFYEKVLTIDPLNSIVLNNYSYYLSLRNENLEKAEQMAKKATELDPDNSSNLDTYSWVLYKSGKYEEAKIWILKALENQGEKNAVILEHYGDILYKLGKKDDAFHYWEKAKIVGDGSEYLDKKIQDKKLYE